MVGASVEIQRYCPLILIAILLVHVSIAASLFIRCVPSNGSATIEMIGQDPHKGGHSEESCQSMRSARKNIPSFCATSFEDCIDLLLDTPATMKLSENFDPLSLSDEGSKDTTFAGMPDRYIQAIKALHNQFACFIPDLTQRFSLRI